MSRPTIKKAMSFRWTPKTAEQFNTISKYKLNQPAYKILEMLAEEFVRMWNTEEGKSEIYKKYYNK